MILIIAGWFAIAQRGLRLESARDPRSLQVICMELGYRIEHQLSQFPRGRGICDRSSADFTQSYCDESPLDLPFSSFWDVLPGGLFGCDHVVDSP